MSNVVISYARSDRPLANELAQYLLSLGFLVWWDVELLGSDDFTDVIQAEFSKARAVVVIWSETSVKSNFVRDEARFALQHRKLVATKTSRLEVDRIPFGFQGQHTEDSDKILRAIEKLGATRQVAKPTTVMAESEEQAAMPGTVRVYRGQSNLSALLSGLALRLPEFLPIGTSRWAAIGLASTYVLASVGFFWVATGSYRFQWAVLCAGLLMIVLGWVYFHKFIRQRLFAAGLIVVASICFLTTLFGTFWLVRWGVV